MEIRRLTLADEAAFQDFQAVLLAEKAAGNDLIATKKVSDFPAFLARLQELERGTADPNWSRVTQYYAFLEGVLVAKVGCRWELKGDLARVGGHISYVTRPDYRGRGIMGQLLAYALKQYATRGIEEVLVTTRVDNISSLALLEKYQGRPDGIAMDRGYQWQRYWLKTDQVNTALSDGLKEA